MRSLAVGALRSQNVPTRDLGLSPEMNQRWRITLGRSALTLPTEAHARLIETWLNLQRGYQVATDDLMNLLVPSTAEACHQLLVALDVAKTEMTRLEGRLVVDIGVQDLMVLLSSRRVFVYDQVLLSQVKSQLAKMLAQSEIWRPHRYPSTLHSLPSTFSH